ncbi:anti-sigma factor family protein [Hydrogenimonas urashimensis]|uniref:anti-sigma factor family protein n=1 Tax=Hydrogenimonas urashimensis TaxID=2740515 RepID=UPI00191589EE|nr:zf-HC2 domain-containing protein [Hydrogenimonas urashimensis]
MNEKALWKSFRKEGRREGERCPDFNELAAYIDGTADEKERARIEAHLNRCSECLETVLALKNPPQKDTEIQIADLSRAVSVWERETFRHRRVRLSTALRLAASLLFFVLVSFGGYRAGEGLVESDEYGWQSFMEEDMAPLASVLQERSDLFFVDGEEWQ